MIFILPLSHPIVMVIPFKKSKPNTEKALEGTSQVPSNAFLFLHLQFEFADMVADRPCYFSGTLKISPGYIRSNLLLLLSRSNSLMVQPNL